MNKLNLTLICFTLILSGLLAIISAGITYDEASYIPAGYSYLKTREILLNQEHPPLSKILAGVPLFFFDLNFKKNYSISEQHIEFQSEFFKQNKKKILIITYSSRITLFFINILLLASIYCFSISIFKNKNAALISTALTALCPLFLAYSTLVINDCLFAFFFILTIFTLRNHIIKTTPCSLLYFAISFSAVLLTKFSALILIPIIFFIIIIKFKECNAVFFLSLFIALAIVIIIVNIFYFKPFTGFLDYYRGVCLTGKYRLTDYQYFLNGNFYEGNNSFYFLFTILYKSGEIQLLLWSITTIFFIKKFTDKILKRNKNKIIKYNFSSDIITYIILPAVVYFCVVSYKAPNIGLRYMLPCIFMLNVFTSYFFIHYEKYFTIFSNEKGLSVKTYFIFFIIFLLALRIFIAAPDYISFFNSYCGGRDKGMKLLDDSNFDWGQDINKLQTFLDSKKIPFVYLFYFGVVPPEAYNISYLDIKYALNYKNELKPGWYVISSQFLNRLPEFQTKNGRFKFSKNSAEFKIGYTLYIFNIL